MWDEYLEQACYLGRAVYEWMIGLRVNDRLSASALLSVTGWVFTKRVGTLHERFIFSEDFRVLHHCLVDLSSSSREDLSFMLNLFLHMSVCVLAVISGHVCTLSSHLLWHFSPFIPELYFSVKSSFTLFVKPGVAVGSAWDGTVGYAEINCFCDFSFNLCPAILYVIQTKDHLAVDICSRKRSQSAHFFSQTVFLVVFGWCTVRWSMYCEMVEGYADCGMVWSTNGAFNPSSNILGKVGQNQI